METNTSIQLIDPNEVSLKSWLSVVYSLSWRGVIITIVSATCSGIIGAIIGAIGVQLGASKTSTTITAIVISSVLSFYFLVVLMKWFLKAKHKNFKIALVKTT